jgi:hypothetical protein
MHRSSSSCWYCSVDRESTTHCPLWTCSANAPVKLNASCSPRIFTALTGGNSFDPLKHEGSLTCHGWAGDRYWFEAILAESSLSSKQSRFIWFTHPPLHFIVPSSIYLASHCSYSVTSEANCYHIILACPISDTNWCRCAPVNCACSCHFRYFHIAGSSGYRWIHLLFSLETSSVFICLNNCSSS